MKTKGPEWHARHDALISQRRVEYLMRFWNEPPCFARRKKSRQPGQDATSVQPLTRLL